MNQLHFLKTVWSDITLLESENQFGMIDTGYEHQKEQIQAYLKEKNIRELEFVIITHFHRDHYGSLEFLLDNYPIKKIYIKPYSGLDAFTALGTQADDNYRHQEMSYYQKLVKKIKEKSQFVEITTDMKPFSFFSFQIQFLNTQPTIKNVFDDVNSPYYHQYV
ncbi:MAG: MBL fold metallo-hydrolase, partial [Firmicutes bacterium]|nr:MBL fold metallo-hydrolase [Bacillota bacterium]